MPPKKAVAYTPPSPIKAGAKNKVPLAPIAPGKKSPLPPAVSLKSSMARRLAK